MKASVLVCLAFAAIVFVAAASDDTSVAWKSFVEKYGRTYASQEESDRRYAIFSKNFEMINAVNNDPSKTYTLEVNNFADISWEEFQETHLLRAPQDCSATRGSYQASGKALPEHVDWRTKGVLQPVKNQGNCGSCWTFSTTGTLEAILAIHLGEHVSLSEQQLVDCAQDFDNNGCNGGLPSHAFEYIHYRQGLESEKTYPYVGKDMTCNRDALKSVAFVREIKNITRGDENELADAVAYENPVAVAFEVVDDFRFYKGGVYSSKTCRHSPDTVNHAVVAVGFGSNSTVHEDYWIIRNSWGADWGMDGYFEMERGVNMCGVAECSSWAVPERRK